MAWIYPFNRSGTRIRSDRTSWWHLTKWLHYWWSLTTLSNVSELVRQLNTFSWTLAAAVVNQVDTRLGQVWTKVLTKSQHGFLVKLAELANSAQDEWQQDFGLDCDSDQDDFSNGDFSNGEYSDDFSDQSDQLDQSRDPGDYRGNHEIELEPVHEWSSESTNPSQVEVLYQRDRPKIFTVGSGRVELNRAYSTPELNHVMTETSVVSTVPTKLGRSFSTSLISA